MKISGSFLAMLFIWILGFTSFLGGPFFLFKILFWILLLPYIILTLVFLLMIFKIRKFSTFNTKTRLKKDEAIEVEATIKE
jgi:hypothetical protein